MFRCRAATVAMARLATLAAMRALTITPIPMPALSPTMEHGKITEWCKKVGDEIVSGDTFCKVETDKAVVSYDNTAEEGFLARILINEGGETAVGQTICLLVDEKDGVNSDEVKQWSDGGGAAAEPAAAATPEPAAAAAAQPAAAAAAPSSTPPSSSSSSRVKASPYARKLAAEKQVALDTITGTGGGVGRITAKDVEAAAASGPKKAAAPAAAAAAATSTTSKAATAAASGGEAAAARKPGTPPPANANYTDIPVTNMRGVIAKRLHQSKNVEIPHYYINGTCKVDNALALLKQLNAKGNGEYKITLNDYIIKAIARANTLVPEVNAAWHGDFIRQYSTVDVSVAVATPSGLITPIVRNAQAKGLVQISKEVKSLAARARENALRPDEFQGGTCSVSNLGASQVDSFMAIINPPQALIVAVGTAGPHPEMERDAETGGYRMTGNVVMKAAFNASFDHRVVDGAVGARWYQAFRDAIENPLSLLL